MLIRVTFKRNSNVYYAEAKLKYEILYSSCKWTLGQVFCLATERGHSLGICNAERLC
jgi:hypothetical protein